ncbi:polysaccharide pyruvyl transferase family protein [Roseovarius dicentrarchi]|uniref:polysaccharide pyruvyl transferase family protein n=1 Tax=Roseovarius dicentrarchi TaxID=2250573 RepID=UPI0013966911|nr:polysaccharide pyruvyl transferase family protein [Roseovarius dicentrarchi]
MSTTEKDAAHPITGNENPFSDYEVDTETLLLENGKIPLIHWPRTANFGDDLSPWLLRKITGLDTFQNTGERASYIAIGSIISLVRDKSIVWGTGSFGPEPPRHINKKAEYRAVRGPLTRARILDRGARCPRIYGDPALLTPFFFRPELEKKYEIGLVLRWSDRKWLSQSVADGVKLIDLGTSDVEGVLTDILSCKRIITSSLHGLVIADAYGIPNSWLYSDSPKGGEFKFYDYFLSVDKVRHSTAIDLREIDLTVENLDEVFSYDDRPIDFDARALVNACPLLKPKEK